MSDTREIVIPAHAPLADLCTSDGAAARTLAAPVGVDFGTIAGAADRTVQVAETHLDGAAGTCWWCAGWCTASW